MTTQSLRQKHIDRTRTAIINAAFDLFLEQGFGATTVDEIAERADVAPRTFFRYFPTKESVLFHDSESKIDAIRERLAAEPQGQSPAECLVSLLGSMAKEMTSDRKRTALILQLSETNNSILIAQRRAMQEHTTRAILATLAERTGVPETDVALQAMVAAVVACAATAIHCWLNDGATGDVRDYLEPAVASCRDAFNMTNL